MKVTWKLMNPQLRLPGSLIRLVWANYSMGKLKFSNWFLNTFVRGRCLGRSMCYRQDYISRPDGTKLRLCIYTPRETPETPVPALLWLHGGGYAMGIPEQDTRFVRNFVTKCGCVAVAPDYRLSLDAPFPAALEDAYLALLWLREQAGALGGRPDQLFVGGDSAGGGLTAGLCLYARDRGEANVAFQLPLYPMLDDTMAFPSCLGSNAPVWNTQDNRLGWALYLKGVSPEDPMLKYAAPMREEDLRGLPPALAFVGGIEIFHDEVTAWVQRLEAAGVPVRFRVFPGCFHGFDILCGFSRVSKEATAFLLEGFDHAAKHCFAPQPDSCD